MNATTPVTPADIAAFAASVRLHLRDLPADELDDLLDGLDADLAEQAAENADFVLPDAAGYAAELRAAAGLPEPSDATAPRVPMRMRVEQWRRAMAREIRMNPAGAWLLDLALALRPVWWLLRGWLLFAIAAGLVYPVSGPHVLSGSSLIIPESAIGWALLVLAVLLSVQWGRGRWVPRRWLRVTRTVVSILSLLVLPIALAGLPTALRDAFGGVRYVESAVASVPPGLSLDGERVRNLFAYDENGNPLTGVQLFDQDGRPLTTVGREGAASGSGADDYFTGGGGPTTVPLTGPGLQPVWNVFPLAELTPQQQQTGIDPRAAQTPAFPFPRVPAVADRTAQQPSPAPTDGVAPPADASDAPQPTPTAPVTQ